MKMTLATTTLAAALGLAALGMTGPVEAQQAGKPMNAQQEAVMKWMMGNHLVKCYGIAARGKNDCAEGAHSCVGQSTIDRDGASFVAVPQGQCEKISGGSSQPRRT